MSFSAEPANDASPRMIRDVRFGEGVWVQAFTNLYGCEIGDGTRVGPFIEIQDDVRIGARCKIQSHTFICSGVSIGDGVFVGHGVMFVNDKSPRARNESGELATTDDWELLPVEIGDDVTIGSGAIVLGGVKIGAGAMIGAGAVVSRDVGEGETVAGVPARVMGSGTV
jgi:acetyltransferase-like isoleucine patch superfamily enzyme